MRFESKKFFESLQIGVKDHELIEFAKKVRVYFLNFARF
jgi:hypothetical protein